MREVCTGSYVRPTVRFPPRSSGPGCGRPFDRRVGILLALCTERGPLLAQKLFRDGLGGGRLGI